MSTFTLAIFCLTTSNLPWFMDLTFQVPMHNCSYSIGPCFYHQLHPPLFFFFLLWLHPFILSRVISPLISSSILGTYWPGEFLFQYPIILPFHTVQRLQNLGRPPWFLGVQESHQFLIVKSQETSFQVTGRRKRKLETLLKATAQEHIKRQIYETEELWCPHTL